MSPKEQHILLDFCALFTQFRTKGSATKSQNKNTHLWARKRKHKRDQTPLRVFLSFSSMKNKIRTTNQKNKKQPTHMQQHLAEPAEVLSVTKNKAEKHQQQQQPQPQRSTKQQCKVLISFTGTTLAYCFISSLPLTIQLQFHLFSFSFSFFLHKLRTKNAQFQRLCLRGIHSSARCWICWMHSWINAPYLSW